MWGSAANHQDKGMKELQGASMRVALAIEYDGRSFCGWQAQPSLPTVQVTLENALAQMAGHPIRVHSAGRTDSRVHASRQIVHFDTTAHRPLTAWVRGVNSLLPDTVSVLWAKVVDEKFHARFSALARHYRYIVHTHPIRPTLLQGKVGWVHQPLDVTAMQDAANYLLGEHDFSSFRAAECQANSPIRVLSKLTLQVDKTLLICDFSANAFLHNMVRNIMGMLLEIGKHNVPPIWAKTVLDYRAREKAPATFMPDGLYLSGVTYPAEFALDSEPAPRYGLW
jgi:tRNA pseudouridine38-40 synthase